MPIYIYRLDLWRRDPAPPIHAMITAALQAEPLEMQEFKNSKTHHG